MTTFNEALRKTGEKLTKSQRKLAAFIEKDKVGASYMTLNNLAEKTGLSTATIFRAVKAFGFTGYPDMQRAIREDLYNRDREPERKVINRRGTIRELKEMAKGISDILATLDREDICSAAEAISMANTVYVIGMRESYSMAVYLANRLAGVREDVRLVTADGMGYPEQIACAAPGDILIAFFYPRYSKDTAAILSTFRHKGGKTVLFTDEEHEAIDIYGDLFLPCERTGSATGYSYATPVILTDWLVETIYANEPNRKKDRDPSMDPQLEDTLYLRY